MRKIFNLIFSLTLIFYSTLGNAAYVKPKKIFISQFVSHPALDVTAKAIIDELKKSFGENEINIKLDNAYGNVSISTQIATNFTAQNPDIIIAIGTLSSQSFLKYAKDNKAKVIFSSVTDPKAAGLLVNNVTGVSNFVSVDKQLEKFRQLMPNLKKLGFIYNPGEINSISILNELKATAAKYDLTIIEEIATKTSDVRQAVDKIISNIDAIYISNDNTALSAITTIIKLANENNKPLFVSDTDIVKDGALAAYGADQYAIGVQTAKLAVRVLNGEDINRLEVEYPKNIKLEINENSANKLKLSLPELK